jgi:signal peptidase I
VNPDPENDRDLVVAASAATTEPHATEAVAPVAASDHQTPSLRRRVVRELLSWLWVILIFLFVTGTMVQARVIPSGSMENTLLVGDHLLMSRIGYDASLPFTQYHMRLWREPHRQQMIIFRSPNEPGLDLIKRLIAMPGDTVEIRSGVVFVNGAQLAEPYRNGDPNPADNYDPTTIPPGNYFVLGDNRENSYDSRYWGFVPEANILGTPLVIYMSVDAPDEAWEPGRVRQRISAYAGVLLHPWRGVRWQRLFTVF